MTPVQGLGPSGTGAADDAQRLRLQKAGRDFEAVLVGTLLRSFGKSFTALAGSEEASSQYQAMGVEALAAELARRDVLGIAGMVTRSLTQPAVTPEGRIKDF
jgi:Rod binding domain-containing protein